MLRSSALALAAVLALLSACGKSTPRAPRDNGATGQTWTVAVATASGPTHARLACYRGVDAPGCDLRVYEVMLEAFVDGDPSANWDTGYGTSHHRGDLKGVTASLDYIAALGANAVWMTPPFTSSPTAYDDQWAHRLDATGYFVSDYFAIDPHFGTLDDARALVDQAHQRGLYVFFDAAFGHHKSNLVAEPAGAPHPGLLPVSVNTSNVTQQTVDFSAADTRTFYTDVATYWIAQLGIDGWRLDQAYQVPPDAWTSIRAAVEQASAAVTYRGAGGADVHPLGYLVAEVWGARDWIASAAYGSTAAPALASAFDFPTRYAVVETLATQEDVVPAYAKGQPATTLAAALDALDGYPDHAMPNLMIGNHDLVRFGDLVQRANYADPDQDAYWARHRAAFTFMAAYSGPVTLYYDDEIGAEVAGFDAKVTDDCGSYGLCDDHVSRNSGVVAGVTGAIDARQQALHDHVATLMRLRRDHLALRAGSLTRVFADAHVLLERKEAGADRVLLALNVKADPAVVTLAVDAVGGATTLTDLVSGEVLQAAGGQFTVNLDGTSGRLLQY